MKPEKRDFRKRKRERIKIKDRILIVCEGEKTEPNYFKAFHHSNIVIKVKGVGKSAINLINEAIRLKNNASKDREPYYKIWCVFDIDDNSEENIDDAIKLAVKHDIGYVYSNEAFELWYLLHYDYHNMALTRRSYEEKLAKYLGFEYKKNNEYMFDILNSKQGKAIKNARYLMEQYEKRNPFRDNPSTTVYELVEFLNSYK